MINKLITIHVLPLIMWTSLLMPSFAQSGNTDERLDQDLRILKEVMIEYFKTANPDKDHYRISTSSSDVRYIEGFGLVLQTPHFRSSYGRSGRYRIVTRPRRGQSGSTLGYTYPDKDDKGDGDGDDKPTSITDADIQSIMKSFLSVYGDLTSFLDPNEKILMVYENRGRHPISAVSVGRNSGAVAAAPTVVGVLADEDDESTKRITAEVKKSDVNALKEGKINEDTFEKRIKVFAQKEDGTQDKQVDYRILAKIFESLFKSSNRFPNYGLVWGQSDIRVDVSPDDDEKTDIKTTEPIIAFNSSSVKYQVLSGLGVIYTMNMRSPRIYHVGYGRRGQRNLEVEVDAKELEKKWESAFKEFEEDLKRNMIEYGRTLRSLPQDEWLMVQVKVPGCKTCDLPGKLEFKVKKSVLEAYDKRSMSIEKAISEIQTATYGKASEKSDRYEFFFDYRD